MAYEGYTTPDKGEGANDIQSILFQEDLEIIQAGAQGIDCVLYGCAVDDAGSPDMSPAVGYGVVLTNGVMKVVAAGTATIGTADATNPRIDLVVINSSGSIAVRAGTAAAAPKPPARTANDVVLAQVYVPANDTTIANAQIIDKRVFRKNGPLCIYRTTSTETTNTTTSAINVLDKTNSGVAIGRGLFLQGKKLRVRCGGNILCNATTPTIKIEVLFGTSVVFSDTTAATTNDADRLGWFIEFDMTAATDASQTYAGTIHLSPIAAKTAPTTGIGDIGSSACFITPFRGAPTSKDCSAGDNTLQVTITLSVSSASNEVVTDTATIEML